MKNYFENIKIPKNRGSSTEVGTNKKLFAYVVAAAILLIFLLVFIGYKIYENSLKNKLSTTQTIESQIKDIIENNIEDWSLYEKVSEDKYKKFGNDSKCSSSIKGNTDFLNYQKQATKGDIYRLDLTSGAYLIYTPNYNNWDNQKLFSFGVNDMRTCSGGWLIPLFAYEDKIVWGNITCSEVEDSKVENCLRITRIIMGYFTKKSN